MPHALVQRNDRRLDVNAAARQPMQRRPLESAARQVVPRAQARGVIAVTRLGQ
jgi:hypothetical protein